MSAGLQNRWSGVQIPPALQISCGSTPISAAKPPIGSNSAMSMDLNRQQKRAMQKMGAVNDQGAPIRQPRPTVASQVKKERTSPAQYIREVRDEMRKVAWPKWPEIRRYSIIVLITVVVITAFVGGMDAVFGILSGWLYKD